MSPLKKAALLILLACSAMMIGIFHEALGLPDRIELPLLVYGVVFLCLGFYVAKQGKKKIDAAPLPLPGAQRKKVAPVVAGLAIACVAGPFVMHLQGIQLPLQIRVLISIGTFVLCLMIVLLTMREKR